VAKLVEVSTYERVANLPLEVDSYALEGLVRRVSSAFTRRTTLIRLRGGGEEGIGEDVTYTADEHEALQREGAVLPLAGSHTLATFSELLDRLDLSPAPPAMEASRDYHRWAYESAALDLALRQVDYSLAQALDREPRPVRFVVSLRLGEPASTEPLRRWLDLYPGLRFKLDPTADWDRALIEQLAATGAVDSVDLKGAYQGTPVDNPPDPELYRRVVEGFPNAWIEDPALTPETDAVLRPYRDRITWDAPIHSIADVEALPFPPRTINVKPSRFGTLRALLDAYDWCAERGIAVYGGGQFELGPGRGQIQYLASLFHPDAPNDVAPSGYNATEPQDGLPLSPLAPAPAATGFRWG
jgi:L-alanine-DL-glutamate epimerase-like enolase superfamily enzyme